MSEIHNPVVVGDMTLTQEPSQPHHAVRLQDLTKVAEEVAASRSLVITNVTPTADGNVGQIVYDQNTIPANSVVVSAVTDNANVRVHFMTEGTMYRAPEVQVNGQPASTIGVVEGQPTAFVGYADITLSESADIVVQSGAATTTVHIALATEGPVVDMLVIGALPGLQSAAKAGDIVQFTAVAANDATSVVVLDIGAAAKVKTQTLGAEDSGGAGFRTVVGTFEASARSGEQHIQVKAVNALGTEGEPVQSNNAIELDQTVPAITSPTILYPAGQTALVHGDVATVVAAITNADSIEYTTHENLSVANPSQYEQNKDVTCMAGTYTENNNYTITAVRTTNGARTVRNVAIQIAATPVTLDATTSKARLRVSEGGVEHSFQITADQKLPAAIEVEATVGVIVQQPTSANGQVCIVRLADSHVQGVDELTLRMTVTNRGGLQTQTEKPFVIGGFELRTLVFPAFSQTALIGVNVRDIAKTRVRYAGSQSLMTLRHDVADAAASYTIVDEASNYNARGGVLYLSDVAFAGSNTLGTLAVEIEEIV